MYQSHKANLICLELLILTTEFCKMLALYYHIIMIYSKFT